VNEVQIDVQNGGRVGCFGNHLMRRPNLVE